MATDKDDPTASPDTISSLSLDTVLEVLSNQRRRFALYTLIDTSTDVVDLQTLIEDVATLEAARADEALTRDRYLAVGSDLYHWHLPVLTDVGIVETDTRSGSIRYSRTDLLETWAGRVRQDELPR
ncbi:hypothetical protein [Natrinema sp. CBA1119]|uniref:DUF7344 domain-containing protein n=1 Tax=Natrinema sp. CBA1119 TaxID=1608465 RepID=UPI000BF45EFC|nr:hypothetical protein [Natrinema sp. CBA1119]